MRNFKIGYFITESFLFSILIFLFVLVIFSESTCFGSESYYDDFENVTFVRNYDGDTITFDISGVPAVLGDDIAIRLRGVDTPEIRGKCPQEKALAKVGKQRVYDLLSQAEQITLDRVDRGKYFRLVADVKFDGRDLATILIEERLGVPYDGGKKTFDWCVEQAQ